MQWPTLAHQPESGPILAAGNDLRWRWAGELRAAEFAGPGAIHVGGGHTLGERGGEQAHTLSIAEIPTHTHVLSGSPSNANVAPAVGNVLATANNVYSIPSNLTALGPSSIASVGGSQAHLNMQPFLTLNFSIALQGIFPSPT